MIKIELFDHENAPRGKCRQYKIRLYSDGKVWIEALEEIHPEDPEFRPLEMIEFRDIAAAADQLRQEGGKELENRFFQEVIRTVPVDHLYIEVSKWRVRNAGVSEEACDS